MYRIGLLFVWNALLSLPSSSRRNLHLDGDLDTVERLSAHSHKTLSIGTVRGLFQFWCVGVGKLAQI